VGGLVRRPPGATGQLVLLRIVVAVEVAPVLAHVGTQVQERDGPQWGGGRAWGGHGPAPAPRPGRLRGIRGGPPGAPNSTPGGHLVARRRPAGARVPGAAPSTVVDAAAVDGGRVRRDEPRAIFNSSPLGID